MSFWDKIGIIGGMGPRASASFLNVLLDHCSQSYSAVQDQDYPEIVLRSVSSSAIDETGIGKKYTLLDALEETYEVFLRLGVKIVALTCNTAFYHFVSYGFRPPILTPFPASLSANAIYQQGYRRVFVLAGRELSQSGFLDPYFLDLGIETIYPNDTQQAVLDELILHVMAGRHGEKPATKLASLVRNGFRYYDSVNIACSELSVLAEHITLSPKVVDNMQLLATSILRLAYQGGIIEQRDD